MVASFPRDLNGAIVIAEGAVKTFTLTRTAGNGPNVITIKLSGVDTPSLDLTLSTPTVSFLAVDVSKTFTVTANPSLYSFVPDPGHWGAIGIRSLGESITEQIPHARFVRIPQAGHSAYFERPHEFNRIVSEFLRGV